MYALISFPAVKATFAVQSIAKVAAIQLLQQVACQVQAIAQDVKCAGHQYPARDPSSMGSMSPCQVIAGVTLDTLPCPAASSTLLTRPVDTVVAKHCCGLPAALYRVHQHAAVCSFEALLHRICFCWAIACSQLTLCSWTNNQVASVQNMHACSIRVQHANNMHQSHLHIGVL